MSHFFMTGSSDCGPGKWKLVAKTDADEKAYDYVKYRKVKFVGVVGSIAHIIKGALGAGLLSGHAAYMNAGMGVAIPATLFFGIYMAICLYLLIMSVQILLRRVRVPNMSYSDVGESALAIFPNPNIQKYSRCFRYIVDVTVSIDLFGSCACYQLIVATSLKQLVEGVHETTFEGKDGYPGLRVYLVILIIPMILLCLIRHLKYLAPFSILANLVILACLILTIYYTMTLNPSFANVKMYTNLYGFFQFIGLNIFSMSCVGIIIPVEGNMGEPHKFKYVIVIGMMFVIGSTLVMSSFGYAAYLENCQTPITVNYPMTTFPKVLKGLIALMIWVTHALNFYVPFHLCFYYIAKRVEPNKVVRYEYVYRAVFVTIIALVAIVFPSVNALMGFIGCLCLSNMAFIWPNMIYLLVHWHRPGLGLHRWRLWRGIVLILIGCFILAVGSVINGIELAQDMVKSFG